MTMERTEMLQALFDAQLVASEPGKLVALGQTGSSQASQLKQHPLHEALQAVQGSVHAAVHKCLRRITATLRALDACTTALAHVERELLLSEAELLSVSTLVKDFQNSVEAAVQKVTGEELHASGLRALASAVVHAPRGRAVKDARLPSLQLLQHYQLILAALERAVADGRLRLALCKEELALYRTEMFAFARCNILSLGEADDGDEDNDVGGGEQREGNEARRAQRTRALQRNAVHRRSSSSSRGNAKEARAATEEDSERPHFGLVTGVSRHTRSLVEDVLKAAATTVKAASAHADTALTTMTQSTGKAYGQTMQDTAAVRYDARRAPPSTLDALAAAARRRTSRAADANAEAEYTWTQAEEAALQASSVALVQRQRAAVAQDAKLVERAVRELSQLTSLMTEQVMQQNEQFGVVLRNTELAQTHMSKAVGQVTQASQTFWTFARQQIALLWACMAFLLLLNWWSN